MAVRITHIRLSEGGTTHRHIVRLWWKNPSTSATGDNTRAEIVSWIEDGGRAHVQDSAGHRVTVGVVEPESGPKYLRTHADGRWTNNLLSLPRK